LKKNKYHTSRPRIKLKNKNKKDRSRNIKNNEDQSVIFKVLEIKKKKRRKKGQLVTNCLFLNTRCTMRKKKAATHQKDDRSSRDTIKRWRLKYASVSHASAHAHTCQQFFI
jgi:hypothetical protein